MPKNKTTYIPNLNFARALVIVAALINAPRYAVAFLLADIVNISPTLSSLINNLNIVAGLAMGLLEAVSVIYIIDGLRRLTPTIKDRKGKEKTNWRWWGSLIFSVSMLVMSPIILIPAMIARMNDQPMREILSTWTLQGVWNFFVVIAPAFIIGGVSFSQPHFIGGSFQKLSESNQETSGKVSESFPTHWRKFTDEQKKKLAGMGREKTIETAVSLGMDRKTGGNWWDNLIAEGYVNGNRK